MKRLIALLLALMLPALALADAMQLDMRLSIEEEPYARLLSKQLSGIWSTMEVAEYAQIVSAIVNLLDGMSVSVYCDNQNATFDLQLAGKSLLDFSISGDQTQYRLTSQLMPGYGLILPIVQNEEDPLTVLLEQQDWSTMLQSMLSAASQSMNGLDVTTQRGSFSGDAYTGGTECTTIRLDDSDIAALFRALMTPEVRQFVVEACACLDMDGESVLSQLDAKHQSVSDANAYSYLIRIVTDHTGVMVGASATLFKGESQLATLSIGTQAETIVLVLGAGMGEKNAWAVQEASIEMLEQGVKLQGKYIELTGDKDDSFDYAAVAAESFDAEGTWVLEMNNTSETSLKLSLDAQQILHHSDLADGGDFSERVQLETVLQEDMLAARLNCSAMDQHVAELQINFKPTEEIQQAEVELIYCDLASDDEEQLALLSEITRSIVNTLTLRLLTIIPAELLMMP